MRIPLLLAVLGAALAACGGSVTGGGAKPPRAGPGGPPDAASRRVFGSTRGGLTVPQPPFHTIPLPVLVRLYPARAHGIGHRVAPGRRLAAGLSRVRRPLDGDGPRKRLSAIRPAIRHSGG